MFSSWQCLRNRVLCSRGLSGCQKFSRSRTAAAMSQPQLHRSRGNLEFLVRSRIWFFFSRNSAATQPHIIFVLGVQFSSYCYCIYFITEYNTSNDNHFFIIIMYSFNNNITTILTVIQLLQRNKSSNARLITKFTESFENTLLPRFYCYNLQYITIHTV